MGKAAHYRKRKTVNVRVFSPGQRKVKKAQELSERSLIHNIHHTHFCNQEVQDAAPGGH